ncbi:MAG: monovalent cation/proton antiporter, MnhG/PhaG subunit [Nocardioidaceae bacterium]|nr:monovalent cation/proton antiporter, MnhG/PhaG subunit [Nocardioidaceae bacterium]
MTWSAFSDVASAVCLLAGSFLALTAAIGLVRFPDLFTRMHAATKPQVLGLLLILGGVAFRVRDAGDLGMLAIVAIFQLLTAPVSAHMVGRAAYRTTTVRQDLLLTDELADPDTR